jgi:hypothetical protein
MLTQAAANQQKQIDDINRAAMFSRIQSAARPTVQQQMGMVSFSIQLDVAHQTREIYHGHESKNVFSRAIANFFLIVPLLPLSTNVVDECIFHRMLRKICLQRHSSLPFYFFLSLHVIIVLEVKTLIKISRRTVILFTRGEEKQESHFEIVIVF